MWMMKLLKIYIRSWVWFINNLEGVFMNEDFETTKYSRHDQDDKI
jgi:hypothetical protein